jgi:hypothetical protein
VGALAVWLMFLSRGIPGAGGERGERGFEDPGRCLDRARDVVSPEWIWFTNTRLAAWPRKGLHAELKGRKRVDDTNDIPGVA